jgi:hypothetical protein
VSPALKVSRLSARARPGRGWLGQYKDNYGPHDQKTSHYRWLLPHPYPSFGPAFIQRRRGTVDHVGAKKRALFSEKIQSRGSRYSATR